MLLFSPMLGFFPLIQYDICVVYSQSFSFLYELLYRIKDDVSVFTYGQRLL